MLENKIPPPDHSELERRFARVLNSMDLPPDKARLLKQYDDDKKWDLICDQERMVAKDPPSHYLEKLIILMDPKYIKSNKKKKHNNSGIVSTQILRDLEISLRTNNIEWVQEFLAVQNNGLNILIQYLGLANFELQRMISLHQSQFNDFGQGYPFNNSTAFYPNCNGGNFSSNNGNLSGSKRSLRKKSQSQYNGVDISTSYNDYNDNLSGNNQENATYQHIVNPSPTDTLSSDQSLSQNDVSNKRRHRHHSHNGRVVNGNSNVNSKNSHQSFSPGGYQHPTNHHHKHSNGTNSQFSGLLKNSGFVSNILHQFPYISNGGNNSSANNGFWHSLLGGGNVNGENTPLVSFGQAGANINNNSLFVLSDDVSQDIHICIMCLRALMNNKYGFNQVIAHKEAINYIALSLMHKNYRTKAQVLELLAAVCLVKGGHDIILLAFDYVKQVTHEPERFYTLMQYFKLQQNQSSRNPIGGMSSAEHVTSSSDFNFAHNESFNSTTDLSSTEFNVDFMVAAMQFINIVVHSVENMNYRVALQYDFTKIGLDQYLEKLKYTECEPLQVQISAYLDNICDVTLLMQEAEYKNVALERCSELQEQLDNLNEKLVETENQAMARIVEMQTYVEGVMREKEEIKKLYEKADFEACTLKKTFNDKETDFAQRKKELDRIMNEYMYLKEQFTTVNNDNKLQIGPGTFINTSPKHNSNNLQMNNNEGNIGNQLTSPTKKNPPPPPPLPPLALSAFTGSASDGLKGNATSHSSKMSCSATKGTTATNVNSSSDLVRRIHHPPMVPHLPPIGKPYLPLPGAEDTNENMNIKKRIETKYRLPLLNWAPLKPKQLKGTIFNEMEDESLLSIIDFDAFEEIFKLGPQRLISTTTGITNSTNSNATETNTNNNNTSIHLVNNFINSNNSNPNMNNELIENSANSPENSFANGGKTGNLKTAIKELQSVLEPTRIRNLAITRRRLDMEDVEIVKAINNLDLKTLDLETVDILLRMLPTDIERKSFKTYESEGKTISRLTPEDRFLYQLCKIERLHTKLSLMSYMGNFGENIHLITPQIHSLIVASKSIRGCEKLAKIFEVILAFGNYLNSSRKGGVYGFKIQSLDTLSILKAPSNKDMSLLHYVVQTVSRHFPHLLNFDSDLRYVEKAVDVSLENIVTDVTDLTKGMDDLTREYGIRKNQPLTPSANSRETLTLIEEFMANAQDRLNKVRSEAKTAQDSYNEVVEYFGESPKALPPNSFFPLFVRFMKQFKQALYDNEQVEMRKKGVSNDYYNNNNQTSKGRDSNKRSFYKINTVSNNNTQTAHGKSNIKDNLPNANPKDQLNEMSENFGDLSLLSNYSVKKLSQDQVYHGALEDILTDLKKEPFRVADMPRKSTIIYTKT